MTGQTILIDGPAARDRVRELAGILPRGTVVSFTLPPDLDLVPADVEEHTKSAVASEVLRCELPAAAFPPEGPAHHIATPRLVSAAMLAPRLVVSVIVRNFSRVLGRRFCPRVIRTAPIERDQSS